MYHKINDLLFKVVEEKIEDDRLRSIAFSSGIPISTLVRLKNKSRTINLHQLIVITEALDLEVRIKKNKITIIDDEGTCNSVSLK